MEKLTLVQTFWRNFICNLIYFFVGADIPGINAEVIASAFTALQQPGTDMVLGPAEDGGYFLVGFNTAANSYLGDLSFYMNVLSDSKKLRRV